MRTIAVINQKGGCGKTTTAINLAAALAELGRRVLLVDTDPQSHCALGVAVPEHKIDLQIGDAMLAPDPGAMDHRRLLWQVNSRLDLAPSSVALAGVERQLADAPDRDRRLTRALAPLAERYDFCLIDCPPAIGLLTFNALRAAREVIIPVEAGYFALRGARKQVATLRVMAEQCGHRVRVYVLPNMYDVRLRLGREILNELTRQFGDAVLPTPVHFSAKLKEAVTFGQPIGEYAPGCRAARDFDQIASHLITAVPADAADQPTHHMRDNRRTLDAAAHLAAQVGPVPDHADRHAGPASPDPDARARPAPEPATPSGRPLTRAAELVQRARDLAARTRAVNPGRATAQPAPPAPTDPTPDPDPHSAEAREKLAEKLARFYGVKVTGQGALFVQPAEAAQRVAIAGDFNSWQPERTPMKLNDQLGVWQTCVELAPGRYRYRLVLDDRWVTDPHNDQTETDPQGETNNIIEVARHP